MTPQFLSEKFSHALVYDAYLRSATGEHLRRWKEAYDASALTPPQRALIGGFQRDMKVIVVSGTWCGDCVQQCPLIQRITDANRGKINLRYLDRDAHLDLSEQLRMNGGLRIPVALFMAEDFELCSIFGDRTLARYRAQAAQRLGPACPTGIVAPGNAEVAATLADWLNEFERIQLMLR